MISELVRRSLKVGAEQQPALNMAASKRRLSAVSKHLASTEVESTVPVDSYLPADQECAPQQAPELLRQLRQAAALMLIVMLI